MASALGAFRLFEERYSPATMGHRADDVPDYCARKCLAT